MAVLDLLRQLHTRLLSQRGIVVVALELAGERLWSHLRHVGMIVIILSGVKGFGDMASCLLLKLATLLVLIRVAL